MAVGEQSDVAIDARVAGGAVHPQLPGRDLAGAGEHLVQWDVHGAVDVRLGPFQVAPHVQDGRVPGGERGAGSQIDQPLTVFQSPAQLLRIGGHRWAQVRRRRAGGVGGAYCA